MTKGIKGVEDLKLDEANPRRHNPRNVGLIVDALHEVGAARSIVIDEDGNVLAGNATVEAAMEAGILKVRVVEANGEELVAVRRTGLTGEQKKRLAYYDNRTAELAEWDVIRIVQDLDEGLSLTGLFYEEELQDLLKEEGKKIGELVRPDFPDLEKQPDVKDVKDIKDENWFYVEFYGDDERMREMTELLSPHLTGQSKHELDRDFFYAMMKRCASEVEGTDGE